VTDRADSPREYRYDELQREVSPGMADGLAGCYQYQSTLTSVYDTWAGLKSLTDSTPGCGSVAYTYEGKDRVSTETTRGARSHVSDDATGLTTLKVLDCLTPAPTTSRIGSRRSLVDSDGVVGYDSTAG